MGIKQIVLKSLLLLGSSILMVSTIFAQEDSKSNKKILHLEYAINMAIDREQKYDVLEKQIEAYDEQLEFISDYESPFYYSTKYAQDSVAQQKKLLKDRVSYKVTVLYNNIIMLQKQIEMNKVEIEIAEKELKQVEIKNNNGQLSELSLAESKADLDKKKIEQEKNLLSLQDYKNQFFNLTNLRMERYDGMEENLNYQSLSYPRGTNAFINSSVNSYLKNKQDYMDYQNNNVIAYTQYKYNLYTEVPVDIMKASKAEIAQSTYDTQQQRKTMIEALQSSVINLEKLQQTIALQQKEIENQKAQLAISQIKYEYGYTSLIDFQKMEQSVKQLELEYMKNIYTYQQEKMILEKPWIQY